MKMTKMKMKKKKQDKSQNKEKAIKEEKKEKEKKDKDKDKGKDKDKDKGKGKDKDKDKEESKDEINLDGNNIQNLNVSEKQSNEKDYKISESESKENNIIHSSDKSLEAMEKKFEKEMESMKKHFNQELKKQKEINDNLVEEVKNLKKKITSNKKKCKKLEKSSVFFQKALEETSNKYETLDYEINLIRLRDPIKNIIDIFSKSLKVPLDLTYNLKTEEIKARIVSKKFKGVSHKDLKDFFNKIYAEFIGANENAHSIEGGKAILNQIFLYLDPTNRLKALKEALEKGKLDSLLTELAEKRRNSYINKKSFVEEEQKVIDNVNDINDLIP